MDMETWHSSLQLYRDQYIVVAFIVKMFSWTISYCSKHCQHTLDRSILFQLYYNTECWCCALKAICSVKQKVKYRRHLELLIYSETVAVAGTRRTCRNTVDIQLSKHSFLLKYCALLSPRDVYIVREGSLSDIMH